MKKIILLLAVFLIMGSAVAFAEQTQEVPLNVEKEEISHTSDSINLNYERIWVVTTRNYAPGTVVPSYIMYSDQHGFTGNLSLYSAEWKPTGSLAEFRGWAYRGDVQPWSLTEY